MLDVKIQHRIRSSLSYTTFGYISVDECETSNRGTFYVENASASGKAYKILIDGINYGIVGAGQTKE